MTVLVTGGSGYFGEIVCCHLLAAGESVRVLDLNPPGFAHERLEFLQGDIRDAASVARACVGVTTVYHNVAQVPLAKDRHLFVSVNRDGTRILLDAARQAGVKKLVYTSSSAVFGVPKTNPVTEETLPSPAEDYGRAKLDGETLCREAAQKGLDVSIIRPRTILGHGRLGVVQILFDWVAHGHDVPVFDGGKNTYQFVHADDLADACIKAAARPGFAIYNIGAKQFGSMAETLAAVIAHSKSKSRLRSVPMAPAQFLMRVMEKTGLSPLGPYHALMYGRSMYFDTGKAERELDWQARFSNTQMICESYDSYLNGAKGSSPHQSAVNQGLLAFAPPLLALCPEINPPVSG